MLICVHARSTVSFSIVTCSFYSLLYCTLFLSLRLMTISVSPYHEYRLYTLFHPLGNWLVFRRMGSASRAGCPSQAPPTLRSLRLNGTRESRGCAATRDSVVVVEPLLHIARRRQSSSSSSPRPAGSAGQV
ncbi:hypothetical protein BDV98DRAFT_432700 [Pterulicium gracile]|uniref:Uncharacterized protein n=1 Tax=Pterulicium gracile TaxID=1884261 RepID=A0A5C3QMJ3_9AGAR|nr:hypothetical protein BDV98DRAFT_432700 [Pterula gracilis]